MSLTRRLQGVATGVALAASLTSTVPWRSAQAVPASTALPNLGTAQTCAHYAGVPARWPNEPHDGMAWVPAGRYTPGANDGYPEERPAGEVFVPAFWIDRTEVTNAQFARFVEATRYVTEAERSGGAAVFRAPAASDAGMAPGAWWRYVHGAHWRQPEGPGSTIVGRENQPVVQVTQADAAAYARWLGRELPSEAQWEYAARARGQGERIARGPRDGDGRPAANFWQGSFPYLDLKEDGYTDRAPVGCYSANGLGLHDMIGNVWEWTREPWRGQREPHGADEPASPTTANTLGVIKGGSFLCSPDFCARYRTSARHPQDTTLGAVHVGFRTIAQP